MIEMIFAGVIAIAMWMIVGAALGAVKAVSRARIYKQELVKMDDVQKRLDALGDEDYDQMLELADEIVESMRRTGYHMAEEKAAMLQFLKTQDLSGTDAVNVAKEALRDSMKDRA